MLGVCIAQHGAHSRAFVVGSSRAVLSVIALQLLAAKCMRAVCSSSAASCHPMQWREARGRARQVVKGYEQGKLSKHIVGLEVGDTLEFKGPVSKLEYAPNMKKALGMVPPAPCACRRL